MITLKNDGHRLFENNPETAASVSKILIDLEKGGMDAVRQYSEKFDNWSPNSFELSENDIVEPSDIAAAYLASNEAGMVNCTTLCVDGGWTAW